ncbi:CidA/LrgA family protein [Snodgrassella sp. CFCC 13594]|uniref:CidA/LrgA family protein n=1 Tax=Snodgrassella sp. CFCC 13594 TaxID=1775559 RepID=UPI000831EACD|nr:CidA/LrgA family protein [Snodgrassella sp. CFCC 13594]
MSASLVSRTQKWMRICQQIAVIAVVWLVSIGIVNLTHIPLSSGVIGLFLMLILLGTGLLKLPQVEAGAHFILGELLFFFLPIIVAVVQYKDLFMTQGWQLVLSIVIGTILVMMSTALTLKYCYRIRRMMIKRRHA